MNLQHEPEPYGEVEAISNFARVHLAAPDRTAVEVSRTEAAQDFAKKPKKVLWVTNLAAPYRLPVWRYLAKRYELMVALLESNAGLQQDSGANRGRDWLHGSSDDFAFSELSCWKYHRGEARYYFLKRNRSVLAVRKFDLVLFGGWESPAYWSLLAAALAFRRARVGFYESPANTMTYRSGFVSWFRSSFFRMMDLVVVPGPAAAEAVLSMGVRPSRVLQGFNAVDVAEFYHAASSASLVESADGPGHRYLYAGRLIPLKRVDAIIRAFVQIAEPDDQLTVVGSGSLREDLRLLADQCGSKVRFLEHIENSEMPAVMAHHHTLVLASEREVWGLVVNEALASGMHVVVSDNCGVVPSVRAMHGVHTVREDLTDLGRQMQSSKAAWTGRIAEPEILQHTPERLADVFDSAFAASLGTSRRNSTRKYESEAN